MLKEAIETVLDAVRASVTAEKRAAVVKADGSRRLLVTSDGKVLELVREQRRLDVPQDPVSFAEMVKRRWPNPLERPPVMVGPAKLECYEFTRSIFSANVLGELTSEQEDGGSNVTRSNIVQAPLKVSSDWTAFKEFVTKSSFTSRQAIRIGRCQVAAWATDADVTRWVNTFRNITVKNITADQMLGLPAGGSTEITERTRVVELADGADDALMWLDRFELACRVYDFQEQAVAIPCTIVEDTTDAKKWNCLAIGNALAEAELASLKAIAEQLKVLLPETLIVLGGGTAYSTID